MLEELQTNDSENALLDEAQETLLELVALRRKAKAAGFSWLGVLDWAARNSMGTGLMLTEEDVIEEPIFYQTPATAPTPDYTATQKSAADELAALDTGEADKAKIVPDQPTPAPNAANVSPVVAAAPELGSAPSVQATAAGASTASVTGE